MRGLTIHQPWAWLIVHGPKRVENRRWAARYRGPLAIHAGQSDAYLDACRAPAMLRLCPELPGPGELVRGAILGVVDLAGCYALADYDERWPADPWSCGPWCWRIENPRALAKPIPYRGEQYLFAIPPGVIFDPLG